jgi:alanine racemase
MAVVKADAYGHGAREVARALDACGAEWFGVATVEEGIELREAGISKPVLLLGGLYLSDPAALIEHQLTPAVSSTARLDVYAQCAQRARRPLNFHLKIDTGMGRLGMPPGLLDSFVEHLRQLNQECRTLPEGLRLTGLFTHLASAEDLTSAQTGSQINLFVTALRRLRGLGISPHWVHISNSAAVLGRSGIEENMVRIGALLYGYCLPLVLPPASPALPLPRWEPVLSLKSCVIFLKDHPAGDPLGYGGSYVTQRPSRIATLPVGYADGVSRALSNRGQVIVRGTFAPIVGKISMDLTLLDVTGIPGVMVGDEVTLIGKDGNCSITADDLAREAGTIAYEVLCAIGKRVPRVSVESPSAEETFSAPTAL